MRRWRCRPSSREDQLSFCTRWAADTKKRCPGDLGLGNHPLSGDGRRQFVRQGHRLPPRLGATLTDCPHPVTRNRSEPFHSSVGVRPKAGAHLTYNSPSLKVPKVIIGERLRALREYKALSQVDMEKRTGLFRYYISRVENGHTIPTLETLGRFARALEVPVFHLVYEEDDPYLLPILPKGVRSIESFAGLSKNESRFLQHFHLLISQLPKRDRELLFCLARKMLNRVTRGSQAKKRRKPQRKARPLHPCCSDETHRRQNSNNRKPGTNPKQHRA